MYRLQTCNAFLAHVRGQHTATGACCSSPFCLLSLTVETISHAFFSCPEVIPVISWFFDTWDVLSGLPPAPRSIFVFLAGDPDAWPTQPTDKPTLRLWHFFRLTTIGAIWRVRCARDEHRHRGYFARRVSFLVVETLLSSIRRDWTRTQVDVRTLDDGFFVSDWWRGFDASLSMSDFINSWATPSFFCSVSGDPPQAPLLPDTRTLALRISHSTPLPLPL